MKWDCAIKDTEYQTACYILSLPMTFQKVKKYVVGFEYPISWIAKHLGPGEETGGVPFHLSGSMERLGKFALHIWNGYEDFNLMEFLGVLDEEHYKALKCAIDVRMGFFRERCN